MNKENMNSISLAEKIPYRTRYHGNAKIHSNSKTHNNSKTPVNTPRHRKVFKTPEAVETKEGCCNKCGKTPKRKSSSLSINFMKPERSKNKCAGRSSCKHKEQLAQFTNVSVTTLESETDSEQSFASTICTQITERSVRSIVRESAACLEIQKLQTLNSHLSSQLTEMEQNNKMLHHMQTPGPQTTQEISQDDTLTIHGTPNKIPVKIPAKIPAKPPSLPASRPQSRSGSVQLKSDTVRDHPLTTFNQSSSYKTPVRGFLPVSKTSLDSGYNSVRHEAAPPAGGKDVERTVRSGEQMLHADNTPYTVQHLQRQSPTGKEVKDDLWPETGSISKQLLGELEEENEALRSELRSCVQTSHETMRLEGELKMLRAENIQYKHEVVRLRDVDERLRECEAEHRKDKASFRTTIEDSLLELDDFRRERDEMEKEISSLEERLKDTQEKKKNMTEEITEQKNIFINNIEKLKLELETGQSENAMLNTRINTIEENCAFLEGQVQALERDNQEKIHILSAAEQHAKDLEKEIAVLKKEEAGNKVERVKSDQLESQFEEMKETVKTLKGEKKVLYEKMEGVQEQSSLLHIRLAELVKSHTKSEESVQHKDRLLQQIKEELELCQTNSVTRNAQTHQQSEELNEELRRMRGEKEELEKQLEKAEGDLKMLEFASTRGWVSALEDKNSDDEEEVDRKLVTFEFEERPAHTSRAEKLIQSIHLDRQKLKAKLVRSVQDTRTLQAQLSDTQEALERESAGLAKRLRETVNELDTNAMQCKVLERTAKNLSTQIEELTIVNRGLELENYHLKKLNVEAVKT